MVMPMPFTTASPIVASYDYFDYAAGAGYKQFYLCGADDSVGNKYFLTTNSGINSDTQNNTMITGADVDFDIQFNNPIEVANANAYISIMTYCSGSNGDTFSAVCTLYHVTAAGTETSLGAVTITDSDGDPTRYMKRTAIISMANRKYVAIGEKIRLNIVVSASVSWTIVFDPKGGFSQTAEGIGGTITDQSSILIPFITN